MTRYTFRAKALSDHGSDIKEGDWVQGNLCCNDDFAFILGELPVQVRFGSAYVRFDHIER